MTLHEIWNDPVGSNVIAGIFISILTMGVAYFRGWFPHIWAFSRGIIFRALKKPRSILGTFIIIVILIGGLILYLGVTHSPTLLSSTPQTDRIDENKKNKPTTLYELFKIDFPNYFSIKKAIQLIPIGKPDHEGKQEYQIEAKLYCDFLSLTKFVSFYIPFYSHTDTMPILNYIAVRHLEIIAQLHKDIIAEFGMYNDRRSEINDLKFTGRIYIYHDTYLSANSIDELRSLYNQNGINPIFRGSDYLTQHSLYHRH